NIEHLKGVRKSWAVCGRSDHLPDPPDPLKDPGMLNQPVLRLESARVDLPEADFLRIGALSVGWRATPRQDHANPDEGDRDTMLHGRLVDGIHAPRARRGGGRDLLRWAAAQVGDALHDVRQIGGFVAPAAKRLWCQHRRV